MQCSVLLPCAASFCHCHPSSRGVKGSERPRRRDSFMAPAELQPLIFKAPRGVSASVCLRAPPSSCRSSVMSAPPPWSAPARAPAAYPSLRPSPFIPPSRLTFCPRAPRTLCSPILLAVRFFPASRPHTGRASFGPVDSAVTLKPRPGPCDDERGLAVLAPVHRPVMVDGPPQFDES